MKPGSPMIKQYPLLFTDKYEPKPCVEQMIAAVK